MQAELATLLLMASDPTAALNPHVNNNVDNADRTISALNMNDSIAFWIVVDPKAASYRLQVAKQPGGSWRTIVTSQHRPDDHPIETLIDQGFEADDPGDSRDFRSEKYCYRMLLFNARGRHFRTYPALCVPASVEPDPPMIVGPNEPVVELEMTPVEPSRRSEPYPH